MNRSGETSSADGASSAAAVADFIRFALLTPVPVGRLGPP